MEVDTGVAVVPIVRRDSCKVEARSVCKVVVINAYER